MPRKRRAARPFRSLPKTAVQSVERKFADGSAFITLMAANFCDLLPTAEERAAFGCLYPARFYQLFGFEASIFDRYPASATVAAGACVFRRPKFEAEFLKEHLPTSPFTAPDLRGMKSSEQHVEMA